MRLQSIELHNYRPYFGTSEEIRFTEEDRGNIYVIQGRNGAGKTSLHEAILWCLHASGGGRSHYKKISRKAIESGEEEMRVRLKFNHDEDFYNVVRTAEIVGNGRAKTSLEILKNGEPEGGNEEYRQNILDNIIPQNVSEFLFFDGEEMEELAKKMNGEAEEEEVKQQIELLIGLKAVQNAVTDLEYVMGEINDDIDEERKKSNEKEEKSEQLDEKKVKRDRLKADISEFKETEADLKEKRQTVEEKLDQIESDRLEELKTLEAEIEALENSRIPEKQEEYKELIQFGHIFVLYDSIEETIEQCEAEKAEIEETLDKVNISEAKKEMVQVSLREDHCELCGRDISPTAERELVALREKYNIDREKREELETKRVELSRRISSLREALRKGDSDSPADVKQELDRLRDRKNEKQAQKDELSDDVQSDQDEKSKWQGEKEKIDSEITNVVAKRQNREENLKRVEDEITSLRKQIDSIASTSVMADLKKQNATIQDCVDDLNQIRDLLVKRKRDSILEKANEVFRLLTSDSRGYDRFEFISEDKYGFQIISDDENRPNMDDISKGEKQIVALSFIIGLNRHADRDAPIIMDTPIARLDLEYRLNLASLFANLDEQIILLVTDASLEGGFEEVMADDIVNKWEIEENTSNHTSDFTEAEVQL